MNDHSTVESAFADMPAWKRAMLKRRVTSTVDGTPIQGHPMTDLAQQTIGAFNECMETLTFRVPEGKRLEMQNADNSWSRSNAEHNGGWAVRTNYRLVSTSPERITLGPEDVPPGSVIRVPECDADWCPTASPTSSVVRVDGDPWPYVNLMADGATINRSIPRTGRWDATAWEQCSKEATP